MRILCLVSFYLPGFKSGGPARTIAAMTDRLDDLTFNIITADRDYGDQAQYDNVAINSWNTVGRAQVFYASPSRRSFRALAQLISETPHDALYLNSYFDPNFTIPVLFARRFGMIPHRPTVVAPRGEFSPGALELKRWKKIPYIAMARLVGLYRDVTWQASSDYESQEIRQALGRTALQIATALNIAVAPDLASSTSAHNVVSRVRAAKEPLLLCFLSRISPKKNLEFALRVLSQVRVSVVLDIYGPIEDARYWAACKALVHELSLESKVRYRGPIAHRHVAETMSGYDLFFLPTLGENFGHVILEAMLAGTPVLLSDTTPWRGLEALGVGWDLPLASPERFSAAIECAAALESAPYREWRSRVQHYARERQADPSVVEANRSLFRRLVQLPSQP